MSENARLVVVNTEQNSVEARDASSLERVAVLPVRAMPHEVVVDPRRGVAFVCVSYEDGFYNHYRKASCFLEVVALAGFRHLRTIDLSPHWGPHGMVLWPELGLLLVTCESAGGEVVVLDLENETVVRSVPVGAHGPHWMAMAGSHAFTANKEDPFVTVVDLASMAVTEQIATPHGTEGIATSPDGSRVFVASQRSPHLYVLDAAEARVEVTVELEEGPGAVAVTPDGSWVLVTHFNFDYWTDDPRLRPGFTQLVDAKTLELGPRLPVGRFPLNVTASADSATAYVSNYKDDTLSVIDLRDMAVRTVPVGAGPHGLAYVDFPMGV